MKRSSIQTSRQGCCYVLDRYYKSSVQIRAGIERLKINARATRHCAELCYGTVKNRGVIDLVIEQCGSVAVKRISSRLINLIRIAVYELIFNPETPGYALINEAVENAGERGGQKQKNFVNAICRNILRCIKEREIAITSDNIRRTVPSSAEKGCEFNCDLFADPDFRPIEYYSLAYSLPLWLMERINEQTGAKGAGQFAAGSNRRPMVYAWPNTLKTDLEALEEVLKSENAKVQSFRQHGCIRFDRGSDLTNLEAFKRGLFYIQDPMAHLPVLDLKTEPGCIAADICAAPGTKTVQMGMMMKNHGSITASDIDRVRIKKIRQNCSRLGVNIVETVLSGKGLKKPDDRHGRFTHILADVPCSNTGTMARRAEVRDRIKPGVIEKLSTVSEEILAESAKMHKPRARICFSTCSVLREENQQRVESFLNRFDGRYRILKEELTLPKADTSTDIGHDGGYYCVIEAL
jgi:16S rRNA (cytosine967-C5)-methyltransferase